MKTLEKHVEYHISNRQTMADMYPECKISTVEIDVENAKDGMKKVVKEIRPTWKDEEIQFKVCVDNFV